MFVYIYDYLSKYNLHIVKPWGFLCIFLHGVCLKNNRKQTQQNIKIS